MKTSIGGRNVRFANSAMDIDRDAPGLVFLHGAGMDHSMWQLQSRYFAHHGFRSIAVDLPGHGKSEGPPLESVEALADWTAEIIDKLEVGPAHVVGHSLGSLIALELAGSRPELVRSLVLLGTAAELPVNDSLLKIAATDQHRAGQLMTSWSHDPKTHRGGHDVPGYWQLGSSIHLIDRCPEDVLSTDLHACNNYEGGLSAAERISARTTIIVGLGDRMSRPGQIEPLLTNIADVEVVEIAGAGHMAMIEASAAVRTALANAFAHGAG
ncbi:MAG: alpha/beta hydrolase [Acidimicrobiales bacterium]